jgi:hypothetical protein
MRAFLFVLAIAPLAACGDDGHTHLDPDAPSGTPDAPALPRQTVMESKALLVGELAEATLTGGPSDSAKITLTAPVAKLDWNLHGHAGGGTQLVKEEFDVMGATYTFVPSAQAEWSLLIRNRHTAPMTIEATIELYGNMQWSGWQ